MVAMTRRRDTRFRLEGERYERGIATFADGALERTTVAENVDEIAQA
jgi:hypothetical protein